MGIMKKLYRNTNHSKLLVIALAAMFCTETFAASAVAVVNSVIGRAFVSVDGRTKSLHPGDQVAAFAEVYTELGAQITLSDYYDHKYHLAGSGHLQFLNKTVQLKEGYLWVQSFQDRMTFSVETANSVASFKRGEGIVSFDSASGKSQILVKKGEWQYANSFNQTFAQTLIEGQFSFITVDEQEGFPRAGTPIGYKSFNKVVSLFKNVDTSVPVGVEPSRNIASVTEESSAIPVMKASHPVKKVEVKKEMENDLMQLYKSRLVKQKPKPKKWAPTYEEKGNVEVRIYGAPKVAKQQKVEAEKPKSYVFHAMKDEDKAKKRAPASVPTEAKNDAFEAHLMEAYKDQMRHSNETNKLINELKSFNSDYVQGY